jgi:hypothetical protein
MNEHNPPMALPNGYVYGEKVYSGTSVFWTPLGPVLPVLITEGV